MFQELIPYFLTISKGDASNSSSKWNHLKNLLKKKNPHLHLSPTELISILGNASYQFVFLINPPCDLISLPITCLETNIQEPPIKRTG